jgi:predicted transposase YdaD
MEPSAENGGQEQLPNPADAFFKETFSHLDAAKSFFENYLPSPLASQIDWSSLQREPESYLDANLRSMFADLLFSVKCGSSTGYFYLLLEHKSTPEYWTAFQLLEMMVRIWRKHLDNSGYARGKLPAIVPIVLHQGPKGWNLPVAFSGYIDGPEDGVLRPYGVEFEHVLVDLSRVPWQEIQGEARLKMAMAVMKAIRENRVMDVLAPLLPNLGSQASIQHFFEGPGPLYNGDRGKDQYLDNSRACQ